MNAINALDALDAMDASLKYLSTLIHQDTLEYKAEQTKSIIHYAYSATKTTRRA